MLTRTFLLLVGGAVIFFVRRHLQESAAFPRAFRRQVTLNKDAYLILEKARKLSTAPTTEPALCEELIFLAFAALKHPLYLYLMQRFNINTTYVKHYLSIHLERDCPNCNGGGYAYEDDDFEKSLEPCPRCTGLGRIPSDEGEELLTFFKRWTEEVPARTAKHIAEKEAKDEQKRRENADRYAEQIRAARERVNGTHPDPRHP